MLPIRVAGLQPATQGAGLEDVAVTDQLLAGLERAVDPDGDGATDDHVPVAVVGVNSPYAGFDASPEARAVEGAADLGTLVVAPAGGEGAAAGQNGTIGSPASRARRARRRRARRAAGRRPHRPRGRRRGRARRRAARRRSRRPSPIESAGPLDATDPAKLLEDGSRSLRGRLAIVRAGDDPVARAAAAAAAGARAVLLAEPRDRPLPSIPAGRVVAPVLGVTGAAARDVLDEKDGATVDVGDVEPGTPPLARLSEESATAISLSPFSSRGPAAAGDVKPDLAAPGAALTAIPGNGGAVVGGTAIAAARAAVEAAQLVRERPSASPRRAARRADRRGGAGPAAAGPRRGRRRAAAAAAGC